MSRLTEEMVIARSKQSDLSSIKKLNCWGSDLSDVSIIKRMRDVEVLALSVNKISTLQPFEDCLKLQELYLRKNNVKDINEIAYLQNLPNLKYLWLEENPCCDRAGPNYRSLVLRSLPNLKKLDNVEVTPEEVEGALKGAIGTGGGVAEDEPYEDAYDNQQQQQNDVQQHPNQRQQQQQQPVQAQSQYHQHHQSHYQTRRSSSPLKEVKEPQPQQSSPATTDDSVSETNNINNSSKASTPSQRSPDTDQESPRGGDGNGSGGNRYRDRVPIPPSASTHSMKEYYQMDRPPYPAHYRHSQTDLTEWEEQQTHPHLNHNPYGSTAMLHHTPANRRSAGNERVEPTDRYSYRNGGRDAADWDEDRTRPRRPDGRYADPSCTVSTAVLNHYANFHRRPINRSSNLLSATLCLVKELDYPSLEVVEHAVRCRLDELSAE